MSVDKAPVFLDMFNFTVKVTPWQLNAGDIPENATI